MVTLRSTQKLLKRMKADPDRDANIPTTKLGDWYADLLYINKQQVVLCISEVTYLAVVLPATPSASLAKRCIPEVEYVLRKLQLPDDIITAELSAMQDIQIGRTNSRRTLGVLNDTTCILKAYLADHDTINHQACSLYLADIIHMPIAGSSDDATRALFGLKPLPYRWNDD